jgi:hypothetical protein
MLPNDSVSGSLLVVDTEHPIPSGIQMTGHAALTVLVNPENFTADSVDD